MNLSSTWIEVLEERAEDGRGACRFGEAAGEEIAHRDLLARAVSAAAALAGAGVGEGERVPLILPTSADFLLAFFGLCLRGAIPCPQSPPIAFGDRADFADRLGHACALLGSRHVIAPRAFAQLLENGLPGISVVPVEMLRSPSGPEAVRPCRARADDVVFIQGTSGSTGRSKAVVLTHGGLFANVRQIGMALAATPEDVVVCWLPLYHDMGLIGCMLFAIAHDLPAHFLAPQAFLRRPALWLRMLHDVRGTLSPAPNFAYSYTAARVRDEEVAGLDLSSWRAAMCGAEPIDRRTLEGFLARFAPLGLRPDVLVPCYGLAEATLAVTFHPISTPLRCDRVVRGSLASRGEVRDADAGDATALDVVSCGPPVAGTRVRIVDEFGRELAEDRVGRVQVAGPTLMNGYHADAKATAKVLRDGWLDTGDLGYLRGGALRLTGRAKDLVIVRGENHAPSDFEWAAEAVVGIRSGAVAAFGLHDAGSGTEVLHLVCETDVEGEPAREDLRRAVRAHVAARTGVIPEVVELWPKNAIPKTTSGKLRRGQVRDLYLAAKEPREPR